MKKNSLIGQYKNILLLGMLLLFSFWADLSSFQTSSTNNKKDHFGLNYEASFAQKSSPIELNLNTVPFVINSIGLKRFASTLLLALLLTFISIAYQSLKFKFLIHGSLFHPRFLSLRVLRI